MVCYHPGDAVNCNIGSAFQAMLSNVASTIWLFSITP